MSQERPQPAEPFAFNEHEKLWNRISHDRFQALLDDEQTTIHKARLDTNSYGEFVFVTVNCPEEGKREIYTLYGCGYHEYRERWFTQEWFLYRSDPFPDTLHQQVSREEVHELLEQRLEEIAPYLGDQEGWKAEWYEDTEGHRSGMHEKNRPGWLALKARLADPDVVALVANDLSRLHRKGWRIGDLLDFVEQRGIRLVLADPRRHIDFSSPYGRMFAQLSAIFDEW
jgi:hypothetical protein